MGAVAISGIDLCAPVGTAVHAFADGEIFLCAFYPEKYDWGHVVVTKHRLQAKTRQQQGDAGVAPSTSSDVDVWALHGHLSAASLAGKTSGDAVKQGDVLGWMGEPEENGEWFPHTHFQLIMLQPAIADCPGVVAARHRELAKLLYPDPRMVIGELW